MDNKVPERIWMPPANLIQSGLDVHVSSDEIEYVSADKVEKLIAEERVKVWDEAIAHIRDKWLAAYPLEVFPEPPPYPAECSRTAISAAMGRHIATKLIEEFSTASEGEK